MRIAVNGWHLVERPHSPTAYHLLELMGRSLASDVSLEFGVFHPAGPLPSIPPGISLEQVEVPLSDWGRLLFEQRKLPRAAAQWKADLLFCPVGGAPLVSPVPTAVAESTARLREGAAILERVRWSFGRAGDRGATRALMYRDLSASESVRVNLRVVPPSVGPHFRPTEGAEGRRGLSDYDIETPYVLSFGVSSGDLPLILAAWTWVDGSVGDSYPLILLGLDESAAERARRKVEELQVVESVRILPRVDLEDLPALYRGAEAFLHPGITENGQEFRWAMVCGVPVAAVETVQTANLLGEAGYLTPPGDARGLGAACLTLLVEPEDVARPLRNKGLERARNYHGEGPLHEYLKVLAEAAASGSHGD